MLKVYHERRPSGDSLSTLGPSRTAADPVVAVTLLPSPCLKEELMIDPVHQVAHLNNSEMLAQLPTLLNHLPVDQKNYVTWIIQSYP